MYTYKAKLIRIVDGDTIDAEIDLGFDTIVRKRIRLYGINTPDTKTKDLDEKAKGLASKQRLTELLDNEFVVETILNKRGKYGRVLGVIYTISANNKRLNINEVLVNEGHAGKHLF
jgi:micrococcal nuclease|tara:strand:- start:61 stop:408 length:348 start_codon:yes stop_codon:yes gene_type:complete